MSANGTTPTPDAIAQAEAAALAHQDANPPVITPPSLAWLDAQIQTQQAIVSAAQGQVTASDVYQAYMREVGALNKLTNMKAALEQQHP